MTKLICSDCQHENEPERIYCHNCGARLDRTKVIKEKVDAGDDEAKTKKHLKRMFDSRRGRTRALVFKFCKMLFGALLTAALVVMFLPPASLPPETKSGDFPPMINMELINATSSGQPATLVYSEAQVNSYLASTIRSKSSHAGEGYLPLRRIFAQFREDECAISIQRQFFVLPIYASASYQIRLVNGKILTRTLGGHIGQMPIHPSLMKLTDLIFQKAWTVLSREHKSVARLTKIEFHPQSVTLVAGQ